MKSVDMEFVTEAIFEKTNTIADIFILDTGTIREVVKSETNKSVERKKKIYESMGLDFEVKKVE